MDQVLNEGVGDVDCMERFSGCVAHEESGCWEGGG